MCIRDRGASEGVGLGHAFLRHIERTRILIHVVDVSGIEGRNPIEDFDIINSELSKYDLELESRPQIVAANKTDIIQDMDEYNAFLEEMKNRGIEVFEISAATNKGVAELMNKTYEELSKLPPIAIFEPEMDINEEEYILSLIHIQYKVSEGDTLFVEKIEAEEGSAVTFDQVLMVGEGEDVKVGAPTVAGATVEANIVKNGKAKKIYVFKMKRKKNERKKKRCV